MRISFSKLDEVIMKALLKYGHSRDEAEIIKRILLFAELRGNNQGIVKLVGKGFPKRKSDGKIEMEKETLVSVLLNGNKNHAMIVMNYATDIVIEKALKSGIGLAGNYNSSESTGALGYYVEKIAKSGLIGIAYASAPFQSTAPFGSIDALYCTNPIAYSIPTKHDPLLLDFSTSEIAYFTLVTKKIAGKKVPKGIGFDSRGRDTTDPAKIMEGAIRAFAGHKGSGLALIVQILAGPLIKAAYFQTGSDNAGNLVMAIDPEIFAGKNELIGKVEDMKGRIKSSRKEKGVREIILPGERGYRIHHQNVARGSIEIDRTMWRELQKVIN